MLYYVPNNRLGSHVYCCSHLQICFCISWINERTFTMVLVCVPCRTCQEACTLICYNIFSHCINVQPLYMLAIFMQSDTNLQQASVASLSVLIKPQVLAMHLVVHTQAVDHTDKTYTYLSVHHVMRTKSVKQLSVHGYSLFCSDYQLGRLSLVLFVINYICYWIPYQLGCNVLRWDPKCQSWGW